MSPPTTKWLAAAAAVMPPLEGPAGTAERLLLLIHYGIDWDNSWVSSRRNTYWSDLLPDRVFTATYRSGTLRRWWTNLAENLESSPRNQQERCELEALLRAESQPVLELLRLETDALILRTRITTDAVRDARAAKNEES